ncbi:MAG: lipid A biosynthesis acyltransferase [Planctomyces sp.]|nr:lipid A biosynthesis acyltransferase [Planctomyces sp.]
MQRLWRYRCEFLAFRCAVCVCEMLPVAWVDGIAHTLAWLLCDVLPAKWTRKDVAMENISRAFGRTHTAAQQHEILRGMWIHLFRMIPEMVQAPRKLHVYSYRRIVRFADFHPTVEAMCSGRRVIFVGGHFGNWEVGISTFGLWGFPLGVIARALDNPYLHDWFKEYREATGHRLMLKRGDFDDMLELLSRGGHLGLLGDQDAGSRGLFVDFFGHPASTFKSIALLALEYDALLMVGYSSRSQDNFHAQHWVEFEMGCEALIDPRTITAQDPVRDITEKYTQALERMIRRSPEQYFWVHRRWKSEPRVRRKAAA